MGSPGDWPDRPATAQTATPAGRPVVGVALASATNPFYVSMEKGIREKAAELGVDARFVVANEDQVRQVTIDRPTRCAPGS